VYCARAWTLPAGKEVPTSKAKNAFDPALTISGYYRTKVLYAVVPVDHAGVPLVGMAGPGGEIRVMELPTLAEVAEWRGGDQNDYVHSMTGAVINGVPQFFAGDESGRLFCGTAETPPSHRRLNRDAHARHVFALSLRQSPGGWRLVSGGADGRVRVWTTDLKLVHEIEAGRPVYALTWVGDDLVVGTDRGMMCLRVNWDAMTAGS
jgi:WD40 repeat protein